MSAKANDLNTAREGGLNKKRKKEGCFILTLSSDVVGGTQFRFLEYDADTCVISDGNQLQSTATKVADYILMQTHYHIVLTMNNRIIIKK